MTANSPLLDHPDTGSLERQPTSGVASSPVSAARDLPRAQAITAQNSR